MEKKYKYFDQNEGSQILYVLQANFDLEVSVIPNLKNYVSKAFSHLTLPMFSEAMDGEDEQTSCRKVVIVFDSDYVISIGYNYEIKDDPADLDFYDSLFIEFYPRSEDFDFDEIDGVFFKSLVKLLGEEIIKC